ncbi:hypothetical protein [Methylorubrum sp. SL192]|uniref:hypothetical protein n=1 Tax=Methylorubrum sp. SL192 TaxID=2995167 RepID=UPI002273FC0A|nr:hypothetical protein [Methylorubrum sp. SL192]MCY1644088.1 hypothetical protein [Methylorubrum sp. SL192]
MAERSNADKPTASRAAQLSRAARPDAEQPYDRREGRTICCRRDEKAQIHPRHSPERDRASVLTTLTATHCVLFADNARGHGWLLRAVMLPLEVEDLTAGQSRGPRLTANGRTQPQTHVGAEILMGRWRDIGPIRPNAVKARGISTRSEPWVLAAL